uniref:Putative ovule protein n=1 Tax=Solanum chacoense TaxID=4108 RepID=A0A0V0HH65_SOLCH
MYMCIHQLLDHPDLCSISQYHSLPIMFASRILAQAYPCTSFHLNRGHLPQKCMPHKSYHSLPTPLFFSIGGKTTCLIPQSAHYARKWNLSLSLSLHPLFFFVYCTHTRETTCHVSQSSHSAGK